MSDTTTGGKASFEELVRLREAASKAMPMNLLWTLQQTGFGITSEFIAYAANHAVTLLEQERAHGDKLAEALAFVLNAPHPPRLPSGACICVQHEDAGKALAEHAKLRGVK